MSLQELENAVAQLPAPELSQFAAWFEEYQADFSDRRDTRTESVLDPDAVAGIREGLAQMDAGQGRSFAEFVAEVRAARPTP